MTRDRILAEIGRLQRKKREWELMFTMGDAVIAIDAEIYELRLDLAAIEDAETEAGKMKDAA